MFFQNKGRGAEAMRRARNFLEVQISICALSVLIPCALRAKNTRRESFRDTHDDARYGHEAGELIPFAHSLQYSVSNHFHTHTSMKEGQ